MSKKFYIKNFERWTHHNNGWGFVIQKLQEHIGSVNSNVFFEPAIEDTIGYRQSKEAIKNYKNNKWVGFSHLDINDRRVQFTLPFLYQRYPDVFNNCLGIFVFTQKQKNDLISTNEFSNILISKIYHPITTNKTISNFDVKCLKSESCIEPNPINCLMTVGDHCRDFKKYTRLKTSYKKFALIPNGDTWKGRSQTWRRNDAFKYNNVFVSSNISETDYTKCLQNNIQFAEFENPVASNYILECISMSTPIFVSKTENTIEYLGENYPFYISGPHKRWNKKLLNKNLIQETHEYLLNFDFKQQLTVDLFLQNITNSEIYINI